MSLSRLKDTDREILKYIDDEDLLKTCSIDKCTYYKTCDDYFVRRRLAKHKNEDYKSESESWKRFFARFVYYKSLLLKFDFKYTTGDFVKKYNTIRNYSADYMLLAAIRNGDLEVAKYAVKKEHATAHKSSGYALKIAAEYGYMDIIKWLISKRVNIHAENEGALNAACQAGYLEIVELLVSLGADIHAGKDRAFISAAENGHYQIAKYLFNQGANISAKNNLALTYASLNGHLEIVKFLLNLV